VVDRHRRAAFVERFLGAGESPLDLERDPSRDQSDDLGGKGFTLEGAEHGSVRLSREGTVSGRRVRIEKTITLAGGTLSCTWALALAAGEGGSQAVRFAPELCLTLLAGNDLSRRFHAVGLADGDAMLGSRGALPDPSQVGISDEWSGIHLQIGASPRPEGLWRAPLETASQSESGFERTYQGSCISPVWALELGTVPQRVSLTMEVTTRA
jgi:alpha-amylase